ncbi:MAG: hypothetical protein HYW51_03780 [Candidatus Doudnabacteria bacterium]|nr:hypothetical protein [Candidatus Doudnabacteria bacterium]
MWLGVLAVIAIAAGLNFYKNNQAGNPNQDILGEQKTYEIGSQPSDQNSVPQEGEPATVGDIQAPPVLSESADKKIYRNPEYEFEFTYPASFGEVRVETYECSEGFLAVGTFQNSSNLDFGYATTGYKNCPDLGLVLFKTAWFENVGNKLKLHLTDQDPVVEITVEQTITIPSGSFVPYTAYIIKNTVEADGNGDPAFAEASAGRPAAILSTPNPGIGALVFRTHGLSYEEGVKLLEDVIK